MPNFVETGPIGWLVSRETTSDRIDPEGKQLVEFLSRVGERQQPPVQQVSIKRFQMADVEDNPVPLRNGTLIKRIGANNVEQRVSGSSRVRQTGKQYTG